MRQRERHTHRKRERERETIFLKVGTEFLSGREQLLWEKQHWAL